MARLFTFSMLENQHKKHAWTRDEKWLITAPLVVLLCAFGMTQGKEMLRRHMGWPVRVIRPSGNGMLRLFDVSNDKKIAVNRSNSRGESGNLFIYQLESGQHLSTLEIEYYAYLPGGAPRQCVFLPDNQHIAFNFPLKQVEIWNIRDNALKKRAATKAINIAISPDAKTLATEDYEIWDLSSNRLRHKLLKGFTDKPIVFSRDGKRVAMRGPSNYKAQQGFTEGKVFIWNTQSGQLEVNIPTFMAGAYAFSPDNKRIICREEIHHGDKGGVWGYNLKLFDVQSKRELWKHTTGPQTERWWDVSFSPDGRWIAVSTLNDFVELRDPQTGALKATLRGSWRDGDIDNASMGVPNLKFTRDGKFLVLRARQEIRIWDMNEVNARFAPDNL